MSEPATAAPPPAAPGTRSYRWVAAPLLAFALVALTAGLLSKHDPRSRGYFQLWFEDPLHLKAGFATAAAVLALTQLFTASWIFRKLPWPKPAWVNPVHRWSGVLAFVFTLPVAYHCIFKLGFQDTDGRVLAHSLFGTFVYGAYASKVTIIRLHRFPRPVLPMAGGLLFAVLIGVWYTSAVWVYRADLGISGEEKPAQVAPATPPPKQADTANGRRVFESAGCNGCHTLAAANATGTVGPSLDALRPNFETVRAKVLSGGGGMPSFEGQLSETEIRDVAAFVAESAGG